MRQSDMRKKLKSTRGESLVEALIACFMGGMALLTLSVMLQTSVKMVENSAEELSSTYKVINDIETRNTEAGTTIEKSEDGTVTIRTGDSSKSYSVGVNVYKKIEEGGGGLAVYDKKR